MTTATQGNAIFGNSIVFHIVDVMNVISVLLAHSASVVVAFSNHALEFGIPFLWVKLSSALSPLPLCRLFSYSIFNITGKRTILSTISFCVGLLSFKRFLAINTSPCLAPASVLIVATPRAEFVSPTNKTSLTRCVFTTHNTIKGYMAFVFSTLFGTKTSSVFSEISGKKVPSAVFTNLINHLDTLKGASRYASQYCCSGNTGATGCV